MKKYSPELTPTKKKYHKIKIIIDVIAIIAVLIFWQVREMQKQRAAEIVGGTVEVHVIDVGQGDSILIKTELGNVLIDAGTGDSEELSLYLDSQDVSDFEYCIFTHPHEDHIGGADMIIEDYGVRNVIMSPTSTNTATFDRLLDALERSDANVIEAETGDKYQFGDLEIFILAPVVTDNSRDTNNSSVIARITYGGVRMMFTGDAEHIEEADVLEGYSAATLDCDFLKMGHHGSSTSSSKAFMDAVTPSVAAISCGIDNSYGHPHRETLEMLRERNIEYHRTDELGSIVYVCDGKTIKISE
ncbi:MAG: MBL fold metallo-hydrolase [Ruminococcaceae bacterium]|nr:MBL fold metallo-hydrolase [Oscillospiraceae bacterium]